MALYVRQYIASHHGWYAFSDPAFQDSCRSAQHQYKECLKLNTNPYTMVRRVVAGEVSGLPNELVNNEL